MQFKAFGYQGRVDGEQVTKMEEPVKEWLQRHPEIDIHHMSIGGSGPGNWVVAFLYDEEARPE